MIYRPEIDGLRALAVLPVVFFHAGFSFFQGGFLGVEIIFVISGYLITSIILNDLSLGNFEISKFYERRARRILPALFLVFLVSIPIAFKTLLPRDLIVFGESLLTSSFFSSNFLFWREAGYFDTETELKPLIHTWSLSVEEQYYLLFPVFMIIIWKLGIRKISVILFLILCLSLSFSSWAAYYKPAANFYLLPFRGWEILSGSLCAIYLFKINRTLKNKVYFDVFSFFGLFLILISLLYFDSNIPMPSFYSAPIVLGTMLFIIFSENAKYSKKLLTNKYLVSIGLISYSLYLWHQPLLAFSKNYVIGEISNILLIIVILISFVFAYASWRFLEQPMRNKDKVNLKNFLIIVLISLLLIASAAITMIIKPSDALVNNKKFAIPSNYFDPKTGFDDIECNKGNIEHCIVSLDKEMILWGDSYAMHLAHAIKNSKKNITFSQATKNSCSPILEISNTFKNIDFADECIEFNKKVYESIIKNKNIKIILMSSTFNFDTEFTIKFNKEYLKDFKQEFIASKFLNTVRLLESHGKKVVIVSPTPSIGNRTDLGKCSINVLKRNLPIDTCDFSRRSFSKNQLMGIPCLRILKKK